MIDSSKCNIYTLDGEALISYYSDNIKNYNFYFDMNDPIVSNDIVLDYGEYNENPLFYQLRQCIRGDDISRYIVFIDFKRVFNVGDKSTLKRVKLIFDGQEAFHDEEKVGINLSFGGLVYKFVPYDKSNSMAKDSKISFIRKDIKEELDRHLLLDLEKYLINNIKLEKSKFLSYRGLYLTDSRRVDCEEFLNLDEDKVIIIDEKDYVFDSTKTYKKFSYGSTRGKDGASSLGYYVGNEVARVGNSYDGEGFISFDYAKRLNLVLGLSDDTSSYQIRMPFIKGVLHKVDFLSFFRDKIRDAKSSIYIKDAYGIDRDLSKVKIILTTSMFKCFRWLTNIESDDIVRDYFYAYRKYRHCLYLVSDDNNINGNGRERLTYQFISAMSLDKEDFRKLNENQINLIDENKIRASLKETNKGKIWARALELNSGFYNDPLVKKNELSEAGSYVTDLLEGKYLVGGESRFLVGVLLGLLIHIYEYSISNNVKNNFDREETDKEFVSLKKKQIYPSHFYLPRPKIKLRHDRHYVILRSPHLSRLEECLAKPYFPESVYRQYFGHLKGVIMVGQNSLLPSLLGGADFDGDHVCVYDDSLIIEAVRRGNYDGSGKRVSPIIEIPSLRESKKAPFKYIDYDIIANTFSSSIGLISNSSIKGATLEYGEMENEDFSYYCEKCTITTGLEIDAAKNGEHPTDLIDNLKTMLPKNIKSYIDIKQKFENYSSLSDIKKIEDNKIIFRAKNRKNDFLAFGDVNEEDNNLMLIPYYFSLAYKKYNSLDFSFEHKRLFKRDIVLDVEVGNSINQLIYAYNKILSLKASFYRTSKEMRQSEAISCAYVKLGEAFGSYDYRLNSGVSVNLAFHNLIDDLNECFLFNQDELYARVRGLNGLYEVVQTGVVDVVNIKKQIIELLSYRNNYDELLSPLRINDLFLFGKFIFGHYLGKKENLVRDIVLERQSERMVNNRFYQEMFPILDGYLSLGLTSLEFNRRIREASLSSLKKILNDDLSLAPYYIYDQQYSLYKSEFFWNVLPREVILSEILEDSPC